MIWAVTRGARPSDGSSSSSSRGRADQGPAEREHLPFAAGELVPGVPAAPGQRREELVDLGEGALGVGPVASPQPAEAQVLVHGQLGDHAAPLRHVRHAAPDQLLDRYAAQAPPRRA